MALSETCRVLRSAEIEKIELRRHQEENWRKLNEKTAPFLEILTGKNIFDPASPQIPGLGWQAEVVPPSSFHDCRIIHLRKNESNQALNVSVSYGSMLGLVINGREVELSENLWGFEKRDADTARIQAALARAVRKPWVQKTNS